MSELVEDLRVELEETRRELEAYKTALFNANLQLARMKKAEGVFKLTTNKKGGVEVMQIYERNPLELLPEEMWVAVFECLNNWKDMKSCYDTCQLFWNLLDDSKNQWLFQGVLPLLSEHLTRRDALKCRQICKTWKQQIDRLSPQPTKFSFGTRAIAGLRQKVENMMSHPDNPFVGGNVILDIWNDENEDEEVEPGFDPLFISDMNFLLSGLGNYITRLKFMLTEHDTMTDPAICHLIMCLLSKCPVLTSFHLYGLSDWTFEVDFLGRGELDKLIHPNFSISPCLRSFKVHGIIGLTCVLNRIFGQCSGQLKMLQVLEWNIEWNQLDWQLLEEIQLGQNSGFLHGLTKSRAPNLAKLAFLFNSGGIEKILRIANSFPKLAHLAFDQLAVSAFQLAKVPKEMTAPDWLKALEFCLRDYEDSSNCDFLIKFPFLETLKMDVLKTTGFLVKEDEKKKKMEIVQISPFWVKSENIYQSNVWELLPFLQTVAIGTCYDDHLYEEPKYSNLYTRQEYVASQLTSNADKY